MKKSRFLLILTLFTLVSQTSFAQREAAQWYFGQTAGLDFNNGAPLALTDGMLESHEGCSTISDINGNLLFYSDGISVWDKAHRLMPNGTDLLGHLSSTQNSIIIPKPNSQVFYYLFCLDEPDEERTDNSGLTYSLIDMSLNNGFGDVVSTEKNIALETYDPNNPAEAQLKCSEKITAVQTADELSFWVITHFIDSFYSFKVDAGGVNPSPVKSTVNTVAPLGGYEQNGIGALKISPNGKKIGIAHSQTANSAQTGPKTLDKKTGKVLLYDFDMNSGSVTNEQALLNGIVPYGIEFSPQSSKLYVTANDYDTAGDPLGSIMYQYDLSAGNIPGSKSEISSSTNVAGALQVAIDGKIYRAGYPVSGSATHISVINNPEALGLACNFELNVVSLNGRITELGLPSFVQSYFDLKFEYKNICFGDATEFTILGDHPFDSLEWDFGDGQTALDETPLHTYASAGEYTVTLTRYFNGQPSDPVSKRVTILDSPVVPNSVVEYFQCSPDDNHNGISTFNLNQINPLVNLSNDQIIHVYYYKDMAGAVADSTNENALPYTHTNSVADEILIAKVVNPVSGCQRFAEVMLKVKTLIVVDPPPLSGCDLGNAQAEFHLKVQREAIIDQFQLPTDSFIRFYENMNSATIGAENYLPDTYITSSTTLYVRIDNDNICYGTGEFELKIEKFDLETEQEVLICEGENGQATLWAGTAQDSSQTLAYEWSSGETTPSININQPGTYTVKVTNELGCNKEQTIIVNIAETPEIRTIDITNDTVEIVTESPGNYEYAIGDPEGPYQQGNTFTGVPAGNMFVYVRNKNGCGLSSEEISIVTYPRFFTPNGDNMNDHWKLDGVSDGFRPESSIQIYDRFGTLLVQLDPISSGWDGTFNGRQLLESDYWFSVKLEGGKMLRGHFTLKR